MKGVKLFCLILLICVVFGWFLRPFQMSSLGRPQNQYTETIPQITSSRDQDHDGMDDQTDILQGALAYAASKPRYKSGYYLGGYPDDGTGVCTDLVANALRSAGYDLMYLVNDDIYTYPQDYDVEIPDINIDFRRVKNLEVYFYHHAQSLTTNIYDITQWQGGDIVIFDEHIGIISDRRNKKGIPYVIHHNSPYQSSFEEDILEKRTDLVAHYRIS